MKKIVMIGLLSCCLQASEKDTLPNKISRSWHALWKKAGSIVAGSTSSSTLAKLKSSEVDQKEQHEVNQAAHKKSNTHSMRELEKPVLVDFRDDVYKTEDVERVSYQQRGETQMICHYNKSIKNYTCYCPYYGLEIMPSDESESHFLSLEGLYRFHQQQKDGSKK